MKIVNEETLALEHAIKSLGIAGTKELERWQAEELEYLQTLGKEDDYDVMAIAYVERLQELDDIKSVCPLYLRFISLISCLVVDMITHWQCS